MKFLVGSLLALALLFSTPIFASDEFTGKKVSEFIEENGKNFSIVHRSFTPEELKIIEKDQGPQPRPGELGIITVNEKTIIVVIVREGIIVYSAPPQSREGLDKLLAAGKGQGV